MKLSDASVGRENNLNIIRFFAAVLVIFSHSFPFSLGAANSDMLVTWTHGEMSFGGVAVSIFFTFGGFLIAKSMERLKTGKAYFKARISRILPCLVVVVFISALVLGPIITELSLMEYYTDIGTYKYLLNSMFILVHDLPGVFTNNIYGTPVNGPLWTLPVEFVCYVGCFLFYKLGLLDKKKMIWTIPLVPVGYVGALILLGKDTVLFGAVRPGILFYIGMLFYVYRDSIKLYRSIALICVIGLVLSCIFNILSISVYFLLPYPLFYLGFGTKKKYSNFGQKAELSYGMYLCGAPIQQIITMLFGGGAMLPLVNFMIALPIDIGCAYVLYRFVEKPFAEMMKRKSENRKAI